jgi:hypothetical protein
LTRARGAGSISPSGEIRDASRKSHYLCRGRGEWIQVQMHDSMVEFITPEPK